MLKISFCDANAKFRKIFQEKMLACAEQNGLEVSLDLFSVEQFEEALEYGILKQDVYFVSAGSFGTKGFLLAQKLRNSLPNAGIVLIAMDENCAWEGYRLKALRCIPRTEILEPEKLLECVRAICAEFGTGQTITLRFVNGQKTFCPERLVYVESRLHKLHFFILEDEIREYVLYEKLDNAEKMFNPAYFVRVHQSFLVNIRYVKTLEKKALCMWNGERIDISRSRLHQVEQQYASYSRSEQKMR